MTAKKGEWVRIHRQVLSPEERAPHIPEETREHPLELWNKGFLLQDSGLPGDIVEVETIIGRTVKGRLLEINPNFDHSWGQCIPEVLQIGRQLRSLLKDEES